MSVKKNESLLRAQWDNMCDNSELYFQYVTTVRKEDPEFEAKLWC